MPLTHLHKSLNLGENEIVKLELDAPATAYLLDGDNYHLFMQNRPYRSHGTEITSSPFLMSPPHAGAWDLVIFTKVPGVPLHAGISVVER